MRSASPGGRIEPLAAAIRLMALEPIEEIGAEVHKFDQFFRV